MRLKSDLGYILLAIVTLVVSVMYLNALKQKYISAGDYVLASGKVHYVVSRVKDHGQLFYVLDNPNTSPVARDSCYKIFVPAENKAAFADRFLKNP